MYWFLPEVVLAKNKCPLKHSNKLGTCLWYSNIQSAVLKLTILLLGVLCWAGRNLITCMINRRDLNSDGISRAGRVNVWYSTQHSTWILLTSWGKQTPPAWWLLHLPQGQSGPCSVSVGNMEQHRVRGNNSCWADVKFDVLICTLFLITRLLEDDVNVSSNKLGNLLSLCGLDRVIALLVFSKILWVALKTGRRFVSLLPYLCGIANTSHTHCMWCVSTIENSLSTQTQWVI